MTCRHSDPINNPECSSYKNAYQQVEILEKQKASVQKRYGLSDTPDAEKYEVWDVEEIGNFLVMKVMYPNCKKCSYEGVKVMVFEGVTLKTAIKWKKIDPHFREPGSFDEKLGYAAAPGPIARFPASDQGWKDALDYVRSKK